jgi:N-acetylglucosaminyl-diphospho-decaprenol L-rhamnosyltransferase
VTPYRPEPNSLACSPTGLAKVGVVVVTHANLQLTDACLDSIADDIPLPRRVVVVNAPAKVDADDLHRLATRTQVIANPTPIGYGANANLGVAALPDSVEVVVILNDDVRVGQGTLAKLAIVLESNADVAVAGPMIVDELGRPKPSAFTFPSVAGELAQQMIAPEPILRRMRSRYARPAVAATTRQADWVLGAAIAVRRSAYDAVGGFDSSYFLYSEETDLCRRLLNRGWRTFSCGNAPATHIGGSSTAEKKYGRMMGASRGLYLRRHWSRARRASLAALLLPIYIWNICYVALRITIQPRSWRGKLALLAGHHNTRPR